MGWTGNHLDHDSTWHHRVMPWAVAIAIAIIMATVAVAWAATKNDEMEELSVVTYAEEYYPGQPLDAVRVNAPTFSGGEYAYKVCDRTSGACWWLVRDPDGTWQVLPVCDGYSYVTQQTEASK